MSATSLKVRILHGLPSPSKLKYSSSVSGATALEMAGSLGAGSSETGFLPPGIWLRTFRKPLARARPWQKLQPALEEICWGVPGGSAPTCNRMPGRARRCRKGCQVAQVAGSWEWFGHAKSQGTEDAQASMGEPAVDHLCSARKVWLGSWGAHGGQAGAVLHCVP